MKTHRFTRYLLIFLLIIIPVTGIWSQEPATTIDQTQPRKLYVVVKNDGTEYIGYLISEDEREVLLETQNVGRLYIPKHEIKEIREVKEREMRDGTYVGDDIFATRYFITTNGLSMQKGDHYALLSLYGPEVEFSVADNLTVGGMTSWLGVPIIGSFKYTIHASENFHIGLGLLGGTLSWYDFGSVGGLAYGTVTVGNKNANLSLSGGYAGVTDGSSSGSAPLFSVAGMARLGKNISFVGDSFIYAGENPFALIIPGLRFSRSERKAFQFGFAGVIFDGEVIPFPIPMVSWFLKI